MAIKKLLLLDACLVALASHPVVVQTGEPRVIVVQVIESLNTMRIVVAHDAGTPEGQEIGGASAQHMARIGLESEARQLFSKAGSQPAGSNLSYKADSR